MSILERSVTDDAIVTNVRGPVSRGVIIFAAWTATGLLIASQTQLELSVRGQTESTWSVLAPSMVGAWMWALYTPLVIWVARRLRRLRDHSVSAWRNWTRFLASHLVVVAVLVVVDPIIWTYVRPFIDGVTPPVSPVLAATLFFNVAAYLGVVSITEVGEYASRWRERERAAARLAHTAEALQGKLGEARLRALESQLQPHFLYNTLNMVAELVHDEPDVADDMLIHLGALLRRSCHETAHVVQVKEEISFVRAYAEILAGRYRDRVTLTIDVPATLEQALVPAFVLQPLVENAFRHGVERREGASVVGVTLTTRDNTLVLRVHDRSAGEASRAPSGDLATAVDGLETNAEGIGLCNIRERLAALYGDAAGMTLIRARDETVAAVWIPMQAAIASNGTSRKVESKRSSTNGVADV